MKNLDSHYGNWLEAKLNYWKNHSGFLRAANPNWRSETPKGVAPVLPPKYHPVIHREMLRATGDTGDIVNQIEGLHISGCNFSTGHYVLLLSPSWKAQHLKENLQKFMRNQQGKILRLLSRGPGTDGQANVFGHTHKEQNLGKFEPDLG